MSYIKKANVIVVKLSYIDLVLKCHDNRFKNGKALAFSDVKKWYFDQIQDGRRIDTKKGAKKLIFGQFLLLKY